MIKKKNQVIKKIKWKERRKFPNVAINGKIKVLVPISVGRKRCKIISRVKKYRFSIDIFIEIEKRKT